MGMRRRQDAENQRAYCERQILAPSARLDTLPALLRVVLVVVAFSTYSGPSAAQESPPNLQLTAISPNTGLNSRATEVRVEGVGFGVGSRVVLLTGGPYHAYSLWERFSVDVAMDGNKAFFFGNGGLLAYDIRTERSPSMLGSLGVRGVALAVANGFAYVRGTDRLLIIDVGDPSQMSLVGELTDLPLVNHNSFADVVVAGHIAYSTGGGGLTVMDVRKPSKPSRISWYPALSGSGGLDVQGNRLYVARSWQDEALSILDITRPAQPTLIGSYIPRGGEWGGFRVKAQDGFAFVTTYRHGLDIIDVRDPATPFLAANVGYHGSFDVELNSNRAFVSAKGSLYVVDISDPTRPILDYSMQPGPWFAWPTGGLAMGGGIALVSGDILNAFDVSELTTPGVLAQVPELPDWTWDVIFKNGLAYTVGYMRDGKRDGFHVVDVSDPTRPIPIGHLLLDGYPVSVDVEDSLACVLDFRGSRLDLIDVNVADSPQLVGSLNTGMLAGAPVVDCALEGGRAYVSASRRMRIYDVNDPASPVLLGSFESTDELRMILPRDDLLYVAGDELGLLVLDVEDATSPALLGSLQMEGPVLGLARTGDVLHVACGDGGFRTVDVLDPSAPVDLGHLELPLIVNQIHVSGDFAFLSGSLLRPTQTPYGQINQVVVDGQFTVDISDPSAPLLVGGMDLRPGHLQVAGHEGYLAGLTSFTTLSLNPRPPEPILVSGTEMRMPVPPGLAPGPYSVLAVNPDGQYDLLRNAFHLSIDTDADGDGFGPGQDCDDQNPDIHPNAPDLPGNALDENCDGIVSCDPSADWQNSGLLNACIAHACQQLRAEGLVTGRDCGALLGS